MRRPSPVTSARSPKPARPQAAEPEPAIAEEAPSGPLPAPAFQPEAVLGQPDQYLKRWMFVLVVAAAWIFAAAVGLGVYNWWFESLDKTAPVFVVMMFVIVSTVGSVLAAWFTDKPPFSALAIGLMSAPFSSAGAAAVLHGLYFCDRVGRCLLGLIPY